MGDTVNPIPAGYHALTPYLTVRNALEAIAFYKEAFGATEVSEPLLTADGKVRHAELQIGDSRLMLADESDLGATKSPQALQGSTAGLALYVDDAQAVVARAVHAGAHVLSPVRDQPYGDRMGQLIDPFGHTWFVGTHVEDVSSDEVKRRMSLGP
jgi:PhnB protein